MVNYDPNIRYCFQQELNQISAGNQNQTQYINNIGGGSSGNTFQRHKYINEQYMDEREQEEDPEMERIAKLFYHINLAQRVIESLRANIRKQVFSENKVFQHSKAFSDLIKPEPAGQRHQPYGSKSSQAFSYTDLHPLDSGEVNLIETTFMPQGKNPWKELSQNPQRLQTMSQAPLNTDYTNNRDDTSEHHRLSMSRAFQLTSQPQIQETTSHYTNFLQTGLLTDADDISNNETILIQSNRRPPRDNRLMLAGLKILSQIFKTIDKRSNSHFISQLVKNTCASKIRETEMVARSIANDHVLLEEKLAKQVSQKQVQFIIN
ncbi:hypothetical protein FGO68_gene12542 [Halteria grandinella]|uniref:Uncharacterized protein n=1 Tax=Halteria grandinella TaxID=5974 RepID=A0A8J8NF31_HALGN|nr:hypothetical protein FGO68_gene12542 [Halteria grandinella]